LFLDEVGDIPLTLQSKLLRVLQEQEFERLGSTYTQHVDVRLVAATNHDLLGMVQRAAIRLDLYYRLNVFPILVPPLRERREDVPALVTHFVARFCRKYGKHIDRIPPKTIAALEAYDWPGNVRELQNLIERAVILADDGMLPDAGDRTSPQPSLPLTLRESERALMLRTLEAVGWVIGGAHGAATRLGLNRTTLINKTKKLGITRPARLGLAISRRAEPSVHPGEALPRHDSWPVCAAV
jgi:formate hydrogenlyase transcriptional activator